MPKPRLKRGLGGWIASSPGSYDCWGATIEDCYECWARHYQDMRDKYVY